MCNACWLVRKVCRTCLIDKTETATTTSKIAEEKQQSVVETKKKKVKSPFLKIERSYAEVVKSTVPKSKESAACVSFFSPIPITGAVIDKNDSVLLSTVSSAITDNSTTPATVDKITMRKEYIVGNGNVIEANAASLSTLFDRFPCISAPEEAPVEIIIRETEVKESSSTYLNALVFGTASSPLKNFEKSFLSLDDDVVAEDKSTMSSLNSSNSMMIKDDARYDEFVDKYHDSVKTVQSEYGKMSKGMIDIK